MKKYYVNDRQQPNGDHEVHAEDCPYLPQPENRTYLSQHTNCHSAVATAKIHYHQVNGCKTCSEACHTQ